MINEIIPGILEQDWGAIEKKFEDIRLFAKSVHVDLLDGKFAENKSFLDPKPFKKYSDDFLLELHMMVDDPIQYLKPFSDAGFQRFLGHVEKMPDPVEFISLGQTLGAVGLAIDGPTPLDAIDGIKLEDLDCMLIMTITAGFSGQKFNENLLSKVKTLKEKNVYLPIEVDGGVNHETILKARDAGASRFVTTSHLFSAENFEEEYNRLTTLVNKP